MKVALVIIILSFLSSCSVDTSASKGDASSTSATPPSNSGDINANNFRMPAYEIDKIDRAERGELETKNEKFRAVPSEFKNIDFGNFSFRNLSGLDYRQSRYITLKNGENEYWEKVRTGGTTYHLSDVLYIDLVGDSAKEAVVFVDSISCGGSCDGGSLTIYFYSANNDKPKLLDTIQTGSAAYGCSIKSFVIKDRTIYLEQFGQCSGSKNEDSAVSSCKFCEKDLTKTVYYFQNSKLTKKSGKIEVTPETNVMNYFPEIHIDE